MRERIERQLNRAGVQYKVGKTDIILKNCFKCKDTNWHLYVSIPKGGCFYCHKCGGHGSFTDWQRDLGIPHSYRLHSEEFDSKKTCKIKPMITEIISGSIERMHKELLANKPLLDYVCKRGIKDETIKSFKLGCKQIPAKAGVIYYYLAIPYFREGKVVNIKYRTVYKKNANGSIEDLSHIKDNKCHWSDNGQIILFNQDCLKEENLGEVFVCEGEIDALTLLQDGLDNTISVPCGAGTFKQEWKDLLRGKSPIVCFDADSAGREGAEKFIKGIDTKEYWNVVLPNGKDVNEFYNSLGEDNGKLDKFLNTVLNKGFFFVDAEKEK